MSHPTRAFSAYFPSGQAFLDEYRSFTGSVNVAKQGNPQIAKVGENVVLRCRFGNESLVHEWKGVLIGGAERTRTGQAAFALKIDHALLGEVEHVAWSHVRRAARREIRLKPTFPLRLVVQRAGSDICQALFPRDVSRGGCQLQDEVGAGFQPNDNVILEWGGAETSAQVRWVSGQRFGLMFDPPLTAQAMGPRAQTKM